MVNYSVVAENTESTVVAQYQPNTSRVTAYQSESELEKMFIAQLQKQAYEYLPIHSEDDLINNLRNQLELLNDYKFTDNEWNTFFKQNIANKNNGIKEKTAILQRDGHIQLLTRDDGSTKNIYLLDKKDIHNNRLQVINQYEVTGAHDNRYDVTVLVNGIPMVHIELKRRGVDIKQAFNQINRYQQDSFWAGCGLYEYIQIFVISNGTYTKYYSNTTRNLHINEAKNNSAVPHKKTSNSFEFTSMWADATNMPIIDLMDFAKTFFAKHTILNILTRYCVFNADDNLLVMRPYQIVATERILNKINVSSNYKKYGTIDGGGYIWHTTGSGKTLTSFKTAQLASAMPEIDKVLFVVDRKDLDYQTMQEYDRFEKGAANSNTSTAVLKRQLEDSNVKIIITTIQKLSIFIEKNKNHPIFDKHIVMIFDECHRSHFGVSHTQITHAFKKYHLFGFTGTPIFAINSNSGGMAELKTTDQAFGERLHVYSIVDAIRDKNVLPFKVDYIGTVKCRDAEDIENKKINDIDRENVLMAPERIKNNVEYILNNFNIKTKRNDKSFVYSVIKNVETVASAKDRNRIEKVKQAIRMSGFNSILAVQSIPMARLYYNEFKKQMAEHPERALKIATIYSFAANGDDYSEDGMWDENPENTNALDISSREFLESAIGDYNKMFGTSYDTSSDRFQNYYKDVSLRMKNREIDLLIVVNMFLTGFDATTLNTLWVDKNLRMHGLLQAYSRTNRILNSIKTHGNIVCFRNLEKATNESLALFGDKDAAGVVLLKTFAEYYNGYTDGEKQIRGYKELVAELLDKFPIGQIITGEGAEKEFIRLYSGIVRLSNVLTSFDEFADKKILSERDIQDYASMYIEMHGKYIKNKDNGKENINDDLVFEMELIKQTEVNIDYILALVKKYHDDNCCDKEIMISIERAIDSSVDLRNKKDLILQFINSLTPNSVVDEEWMMFVNQAKINELNKIITQENLNKEETFAFINNSLRNGFIQTHGQDIERILPPMSRFDKNTNRTQRKRDITMRLLEFFDRFFGVSNGEI